MKRNVQMIGLYETNEMIISNESDVQVEELFHVIRKMSRWLDCFENEIIFINESKVLMKQLFLKGYVLIKESLWKFWEMRDFYKIMRCKKMISLESIVFWPLLKHLYSGLKLEAIYLIMLNNYLLSFHSSFTYFSNPDS